MIIEKIFHEFISVGDFVQCLHASQNWRYHLIQSLKGTPAKLEEVKKEVWARDWMRDSDIVVEKTIFSECNTKMVRIMEQVVKPNQDYLACIVHFTEDCSYSNYQIKCWTFKGINFLSNRYH